MAVEYITTDKGDKTKVVIPLSDYKKLIAKAEELDEIKAYDKAKREDDGKRIPIDKLLKKYAVNK
jgi:hypothetical protein